MRLSWRSVPDSPVCFQMTSGRCSSGPVCALSSRHKNITSPILAVIPVSIPELAMCFGWC